MIDTNVVVVCGAIADDDDYCEAEFELFRTGVPADLHEIVQRELELRGWQGSVTGQVTCPLHDTKEVMP